MPGKRNPDLPRCGAKNSRGKPCRRYPVGGAGTRCKFHGGLSLRGPLQPSWNDGRFSKWKIMETARQLDLLEPDERMFDLAHDISLIDAWIGLRLKPDIEDGFGATGKELRAAFSAVETAATKEPELLPAAINTLRSILQRRDRGDRGMSELKEWERFRTELVDRERKYRLEKAAMIRPAELSGMLVAIAAIVGELSHVESKKFLVDRLEALFAEYQDAWGLPGRRSESPQGSAQRRIPAAETDDQTADALP